MSNSKYPNSLENCKNREYTLYSLSLEIAMLMGKMSVKKGLESLEAKKAIETLTCRLSKLLEVHRKTLKTKGW